VALLGRVGALFRWRRIVKNILIIILLFYVLDPALSAAQGVTGSRPIRIIVPVAPGGPSDTAVRLIVPKLSEALNHTLVVDNRPSANGVAGTEIAAKAAPDGYTLAIGNSGTQAINASLYRKLPYNPLRDFVPITQIVTSGMVLVANPKVPAATLSEFIALAKKQPGRLNMGVAGATGEIAGEALMAQAHIRLNNVRYKGSSPTEFAVVSGEVEATILTPLASATHISAGRLKALGVTSAQRSPVLPNVPTIAELGMQGYDFQIWHGVFAPAKTPSRVVRDVYKGVLHALEAPDVKDRFTQLGFVIIGNTPEEFSAVVKREVEKYRKIITEAGIQVE
jgi:tripartite-type tricarboxylate transporter receptor subunit TctC